MVSSGPQRQCEIKSALIVVESALIRIVTRKYNTYASIVGSLLH
jgi:hypothetical protein